MENVPRSSATQPPASAEATLISLEIEGRPYRLELLVGANGDYRAHLNGEPIGFNALLIQSGILSLILDRRVYRCVLLDASGETSIQVGCERFLFRREDQRSLSASRKNRNAGAGSQSVKAPMPGRVIRILVEIGEVVETNQGVIVIEAMKMQNELKTPRAGRVAKIQVAPGATVGANETLIVIE